MNGTRKLTAVQAQKISNQIKIPRSTLKQGVGAEMDLDVFKVIADWQHFAILNLTQVEGFKSEPRYVAKRLGLSIHTVKRCVQRLQDVGLLAIDS